MKCREKKVEGGKKRGAGGMEGRGEERRGEWLMRE